MGQFLKNYGESIYGTRGGPFIAPDETQRPTNTRSLVLAEGRWWGGSTHRDNAVYLHILRWPSETITLPAIPRRILRHSVLTGGEVVVKQTGSRIEFSVPRAVRGPVDTIVKLELDGSASGIGPIRSA
jgi:alpha-L-fucosidase